MARSALLAVVVVLLLAGLALAAYAAPPDPLPAAGRVAAWVEEGSAPPAPLGGQQPPQKAAPARAPASLPEWTRLAFQSYRDGNWEVYRANGDGSGQVRLTTDPHADILPRLNRGCTRIAFSSNRSGNYEVYTMEPDGSGLVQHTFSAGHDLYPAWSPDGTRLAFQSTRDDQSEVYVLNLADNGASRLTWDAGYDGEPAWSPDGTRIAFTSDRNPRIWTMNADGSGQVPRSNAQYSENAAWEPDGRTSRLCPPSRAATSGWPWARETRSTWCGAG